MQIVCFRSTIVWHFKNNNFIATDKILNDIFPIMRDNYAIKHIFLIQSKDFTINLVILQMINLTK